MEKIRFDFYECGSLDRRPTKNEITILPRYCQKRKIEAADLLRLHLNFFEDWPGEFIAEMHDTDGSHLFDFVVSVELHPCFYVDDIDQ